ncbi:hypothetical protein [Pyxidicoccus trucidator]|uniref:hypothetical protein n=1 Tax=Pyxidicoccus trucidator TaxID=2709662 RepID=UPI0013D9A6F4|nr:hypothetical protein [Pyxidicoccus trucidator]
MFVNLRKLKDFKERIGFDQIVFGSNPDGEISVQIPGTPLRTVFWLFHNVYVELRDTSGSSVEPLARSIQGFLERRVSQPVCQDVPRIDKVTVSKTPLHVNDEVEFQVHPEQSREPEQSWIHIQARPDELELVSRSEASSTYRAIRPGTATIDAWLSDLKLLLMSQAQARVDVQPKK